MAFRWHHQEKESDARIQRLLRSDEFNGVTYKRASKWESLIIPTVMGVGVPPDADDGVLTHHLDGDCDGTKAADHATDVCVAASGSGGGDVSRAAARFVSPATRIVSPARDMAPVLRARALFTPRRVSLSVQVVSPT